MRRIIIFSFTLNVVLAALLPMAIRYRDNQERARRAAEMPVAQTSGNFSGRPGPDRATRLVPTDPSAFLISESDSVAPLMNDPAALVARMREDGYPLTIIRVAVASILIQRMGDAYNPIAFQAELYGLLPEARGIDEDRSLITELTETDVDALRFGDLSPEKVDRIKEVELSLRSATEAEYEASIRPLLLPDEADDFLTFNSPRAQKLQRIIQPIDVDEATYRALYDAMGSISAGAADSQRGSPTADQIQNRTGRLAPASVEEIRAIRGVLNEDDFMALAKPLSLDFAGPSLLNLFSADDVAEAVIASVRVNEAIPSGGARAIAQQVYQQFSGKLATQEQRDIFDDSKFGNMLRRYMELP